LLRVRWFGIVVGGAGKAWVADGINGSQPVLICLLEDVVDVAKDGVKLINGLAEPLDVGLKVVEGFVMA